MIGVIYSHLRFITKAIILNFFFLSEAASRGVVSWTCDPVLALGKRFDSHTSAAIPLVKGLSVHYLVFSDGT